MEFTRRTSGAVGVWLAFMVCGVHQAVAGSDPPSPAAPVQPVKADTAVAAPAATPASTTTVTEGATPAATPASTTTATAARVPAVVVKSTHDKNDLEDPMLTHNEVKRLLSEGYKREKMSNGDIQYCRQEDHLGSMIAKKQCVTGGQLKAMGEDQQQLNELVREKAGVDPRPSLPHQ